ncbi:TPA: hypothetical protein UM350_003290 [Stenotrophomonas maltophilia]|uniref:hypothetical protein n=1 Tax=Stenotrophomonas maltophilia TaxID=40324 RepID=UPI001AAFE527|nr:hypothetical protein [Stenotrophomonas maltophilia]MBN5123610.1 hypothetical protein [Stenotrophomonas maltophilia]MBO3002871.1 hypothetical protein [Stenotrophomonas maltophilia]MBP1381326.1 hypothetical protein [Stenotrophomonas maltophilia]MBP1385570.1 hypothetical protein [Stenotrophomonas maltophilia]HEL4108595.1 hypothetical protein [Stenotrophomonas maltophilia]
MAQIGPELGRHINQSLNATACMLFGLLLLAAALLLMCVIGGAPADSRAFVATVGLAAGATGGLLVALGLWFRRRRWIQGEHGIERLPDGNRWLYE